MKKRLWLALVLSIVAVTGCHKKEDGINTDSPKTETTPMSAEPADPTVAESTQDNLVQEPIDEAFASHSQENSQEQGVQIVESVDDAGEQRAINKP